jgi:hypothetical protein
MEGSLSAAYSVLDGSAYASWTFSIPKVGQPIQHYELTKIPWHAGIMGDRRQDTSLIGNLTLIGKEHEGVAGEPWTENQLHWSAKIDVACRALCPAFGANPPTLRLNMWEHNWLSATSCPSGRNPWNAKFALISSLEDDMNDEEFERRTLKVLQTVGLKQMDDGGNESGPKRTTANWMWRLRQLIKELEATSGGGDYTDEDARRAVKERL